MTAIALLVDDVNKALSQTLSLLQVGANAHTAASVANQRATLEWPGVFVTEYSRPNRNVLFDPVRDANPFFHYLESMWILAGRDDVEFLQVLLPRMKDYSDNGRTFHGAYGYRLRNWQEDIDQIEVAIGKLAKDPSSRQVVMSIWNPVLDLGAVTKDMPCNDLIMLKIRDGKLNITVNNRSNDAVLGAYGANVVQFSMLQMYMAARLNVGVGRYTQVSDSMHVYTDDKYWQKFIAGEVPKFDSPYDELGDSNLFVDGIEAFDKDLFEFFANWSLAEPGETIAPEQGTSVCPAVYDCYLIYNSLMQYRKGDITAALDMADRVHASDWGMACAQWLKRREAKKAVAR